MAWFLCGSMCFVRGCGYFHYRAAIWKRVILPWLRSAAAFYGWNSAVKSYPVTSPQTAVTINDRNKSKLSSLTFSGSFDCYWEVGFLFPCKFSGWSSLWLNLHNQAFSGVQVSQLRISLFKGKRNRDHRGPRSWCCIGVSACAVTVYGLAVTGKLTT